MMEINLSGLTPKHNPDTPPGVYSVTAIPNFPRHYIGRDHQGRVCVLLGSVDTATRAPVRLAGLDVQYALTCAVRIRNGADSLFNLTVVTCTGYGDDVERYFLHILGTLIKIVGEAPTLLEVAESVTQLAGIFQRLTLAARASVAGVIGELVLVASSADAVAAVAAWRTDPDERYDFVLGKLRLEVKSSLTRRRVHGFSFEQCNFPIGCRGIVASTFVERSAGGLSLEGLIGLIGQKLMTAPDSVLKLEKTLAETLGIGLPDALTFSFDYDLACAELAFYDLKSVPAIRGTINPFLSQVRFVSDLSHTKPLDPMALYTSCSDFGTFCAELSLNQYT
jgi:hypothetical protein